MKTIVNAFFIVIAFLLGIVDTVAKNNPPVPNPNGRTNDEITPPPLPIDDSLLVLLIIAILFGIYIIYNKTIEIKKTNLKFFRSFKCFD
jgi:hypothetical protein